MTLLSKLTAVRNFANHYSKFWTMINPYLPNLKGKVAIVTGAGRKLGIGRGIALRLARDGADVAVADICREFEEFPGYALGMWEGLKETADEISALGVRSLPVKVDVTDAGQVDKMVRQTVETLGRLDIIVNNAGGVVTMS